MKQAKKRPAKVYLLADLHNSVDIYLPSVIEVMKYACRLQERHPQLKLRRVASSVYVIE